MAGNVSEESSVGRSMEGQACQSSDALVEWRSSEQVENGTPSTSPPYWDTDDSDDDGGLKPSELYGKNTWKIEKFSQINKRELRSNAFEVGGYKWYILIYPQGCDVCNHLSLFLCVANHDKLLPGWSHFAQFTIAVVNKDPKKSKYSDTLHRFWKKEHDWGWKKFMELSKVSDGFLDSDTLIIKAQVQVIREKADRPFRCLDCQYRRELVRVYLTNVEQICRRFVEERRGKLGKLIEDKARWSSFCAFWLGMDQNTRHRMSMEKKDMILKVVVKHFFIEKEVTSTLVMDSLYSGLKALEGQSKGKKGKVKSLESEETPAPIVQVEKDMFVLVDDVLLLLERAAVEPLPPKDDKGPQNRTKDGGNGEEFNKDTIERDERRLTELGRRTVEIFALAHIFCNKIEVAYQEAISLKRQEELIREEEAAWLAESEQKAKRGAEKDKKSKKKQGKQKRNNRKGKDKGKSDKSVVAMNVKHLHENPAVENSDLLESQTIPEKDDILEDGSGVSDSEECANDVLQHDSEDRGESPVNWDTDMSEILVPAEVSGSEISIISTARNGGVDKRSSSFMDDSSSTCSTDSTPSTVTNGSCRSNSFVNYRSHESPTRGKNQRGKMTYDEHGGATHSEKRPYVVTSVGFQNDTSEGVVTSLQDRTKWPELCAVKKDEEAVLLQRKPSKVSVDAGTSRDKMAKAPSLCRSPPKNTSSVQAVQSKSDSNSISHTHLNPIATKTTLNVQQQSDKPSSPAKASSSPVKASLSPVKASSSPVKASSSPTKASSAPAKVLSSPVKASSPLVKASNSTSVSNPDSSKMSPKHADKPTGQQAGGLSRPSSAPVTPGTMSSTPVVSMTQTVAPSAPLLSRSASATGRLGPEPSSVSAAYVPQSYRNAITGSNSLNPSSVEFPQPSQPASLVNGSTTFSQQATFVPASMYLPQVPDRLEPNRFTLSNSLSATPQEEVLGGHPWMETPMLDRQRFDLYRPLNRGSHEFFPSELSTGTSGRQVQGAVADEFPHLDIINDLLDDEHGLGRVNTVFPGRGNCPNFFNGQFTHPSDTGLSSEMGTLASSSRFDRSRSYHDDRYQQDYGTCNHYDAMGELIPQDNSLPCMNGQIESLGQNQWQYPDLSMLGLSSGMDGYSYSVSDYSNMACGINGYTMFRPSNGH